MQSDTTTFKPGFTFYLSWIGLAIGLLIAFFQKKGFWVYVGYAFLFSLIGTAVGYAADVAIASKAVEIPAPNPSPANTST